MPLPTVKAKRKKTPAKIETAVIVKSRRRCSLCFHLSGDTEEKLGQIAHLDRNSSNFEEDNLAFLCLNHHTRYDSITSQDKNYSEGEAKEARKKLYNWLEKTKPPLPGTQLKTYSLPPLRLEATASGFARLLRGEGYTELVGEIDIRITGRTQSKAGGLVEAEIAVVLSTNITNRIDSHGLTDVALVSHQGKVVSRARMGHAFEAGFHRITFSNVALKASKGVIDVRFSIVGLRANAMAVGLSNNFGPRGSRIEATVDVSLYPGGKVLLADQIIVGLVRGRTLFSVWSSAASVTFRGSKAKEGASIHTFTVECKGVFDEWFKPRDVESFEIGRPDVGTVIGANLSGIGSGIQVLVTAHDLPPQGVARNWKPRAIAVKTDANGYPSGVRDETSEFVWNRNIPLVVVEGNLACWEITREIPYGDPPIVVFGFAVVIPEGVPYGQPQVACGLSPFYTTAAAGHPSGSLPIPRFTPGTVPVNLPLASVSLPSK